MSDAPARRLLLDLGHLGADGGALRAATEFGALLELDMIGIYVEDEALIHLGGAGFAREFRLPGQGWNPLDAGRILNELAGIAEHARRRLEQEVAALGRPARFERLRGDPGEAIASRTGPLDILATGFAGAMDLACRSLRRAQEAAWRSEASVLLLPHGVARRRGPVVLVATSGSAAGLDAAIAVAAAARERLLLLAPRGLSTEAAAAAATRHGISAEAIERREISEASRAGIDAALGRTAERLIVLPREAEGSVTEASALAALRRIPVLLAEPPRR